MLNAGSAIAFGSIARYGSANWGRVNYRTGHGFNIIYDPAFTPHDGALTVASADGKQRYGRNSTFPTHVGIGYLSYMCSYGLREDPLATHIKTTLFWNKGWTPCLNRISSRHPSAFNFGGHSIGSAGPNELVRETSCLYTIAKSENRTVALQNLVGFTGLVYKERLNKESARLNTQSPYNLAPVLTFDEISGEQLVLAALMWTGASQQDATPWNLKSSTKGNWVPKHDTLPDWDIEHPDLPGF